MFIFMTKVPFVPSISEEEVQAVQTAWATAIKTISKTYLAGGKNFSRSKRNMGNVSAVLYGLYGNHEGILQRHRVLVQNTG